MSDKKSKNANIPDTGCKEAMLECPECRKTFYCTNIGAWCYRKEKTDHSRTMIFCSWSCLRKHEKRIEEKIAENKEGKRNHFRGKRLAKNAKSS